MGKSLVIVESPTKAKTIAGFLPKGFVVESSLGHIRDLPNSAKEVPPHLKSEPWARLGINIERDFEPVYVIPPEKKKVVARLKSALKDATALYLATDEDREGESISWHLVDVLKPRIPQQRLVFHEITREAIEEALQNPREISERLVEAQETRRILDRLYGYEISPVLWRKIAPRLSAGRVQSVAIRIIVERERERQRFVRSTYWDLVASFRTREGGVFEATLVSLGGRRVAQGSDFDADTGKLRAASEARSSSETRAPVLVDQAMAEALLARLGKAGWTAIRVESKPDVERPSPPFTTSTLQQEANRKLRLSARDTMKAAQRLYEGGFITYMRTDSTTLSDQAVRQTRRLIESLYGQAYLSASPRQYQTRVKNAQEAHEAIRPAGGFRLPEDLREELSDVELKLYELIWKRTMACQMADARVFNLTVQVSGSPEGEAAVAAGSQSQGEGALPEGVLPPGDAVFQATGRTIEFPGFLRAYVEGADDPDQRLADMERTLPSLEVGEALSCERLDTKGHTTQPPRRYTEASLVKELESNGVGRPSTYAAIIDTILRREYVVKQGNTLVPTFVAFAVVSLLEKNFSELVDVQFTARMEDDLDAISLGESRSLPYLKSFYFGNGGKVGLRHLLERDIDPRESCTIPLGKDARGRAINVRIGRYGPYLERGEDRAPIPVGLPPDEVTLEKAEELLDSAAGPRCVGNDPATGKPVYVKTGRFGPYVQLGENGGERPKMKSLLAGMKPEAVTLDDALRLLSLPKSLGQDPSGGEEVFVDFGRFGPYVKRGSDTRSLPKTENVFEVTLDRALQVLAVEKPARGWRARSPTVLRELGTAAGASGAASGASRPVQLLDGRYGPYVSDGETNASVPRGTDLSKVTLEEALEWIRARAQSGKGRRPGAGARRFRRGAGRPAGGEKSGGAASAGDAPGAGDALSGDTDTRSAGPGASPKAGRAVTKAPSASPRKPSARSGKEAVAAGARSGQARRSTSKAH